MRLHGRGRCANGVKAGKGGRNPPERPSTLWVRLYEYVGVGLWVKTTPLEVLGMVDYLRSHLEPGEISALRKRLASTDGSTRGMDGHQRVGVKLVCPVLVDGQCTADRKLSPGAGRGIGRSAALKAINRRGR